MTAIVGLCCVAGLLGVAAMGIVAGRTSYGTVLFYGASLLACLSGLVAAFCQLLQGSSAAAIHLALGLPGLGANFRLDALSAFFLVVANLGAAAASLYALGYGRHEQAPLRVLPFYPAYLAGMNLVVLADDAFSFLIA